MEHYMPEIFWHDRKALLSVDFHPIVDGDSYRIVTSSVQKEVRIWKFEYEQCVKVSSKFQLAVTFLANLSGHNVAINQVKFSQNPEVNLLASGDSDGRVAIWQLSSTPSSAPPVDDLPPNKENWIRMRVINHDSEVTSLAWSPDGKLLASVSNDESLFVHDVMSGANLEVGTHDLFGTLVFKRSELEKLPYRILWLALTKDSVYLYDSQHPNPIGLVENIQYNSLTDAAWSSDGKNIVISSLEGYCTFLKLTVDQWGCKIGNEELPQCPSSPQLIQTKKRKARDKKIKDLTENKNDELCGSPSQSQKTPLRPAVQQLTSIPRSGSLFRYLQTKEEESLGSSQPTSPTTPSRDEYETNCDETDELAYHLHEMPKADNTPKEPSKMKKRIELITLPD
ncbi:WD domain, G-beta repeat protein [Necator americanus]|uniref:WD domain, G-beta repeat protein n=1 Tax=Necator americanus TaxID=51031 RepID=W2TID8_NECAM|nr:WD domain, G-beta repeat protein [Necator americanus]ETN81860.1 WD domain, G-beta repeat protein [Necator americanus]